MKAEIETIENSAGQTCFLQQINYKKNKSAGGELLWTECLWPSKIHMLKPTP